MAVKRVSGVQMIVSKKIGENLDKMLGYIEATDSDFIVFPEMAVTGFHGKFSEPAAEKAWKQIAEACRRAYVTAIVGTGAKEDGATYIQSRIYADDGSLLGTHEKLVPTSTEREFACPGSELRVFRRNGVVFGCLICNDLWVTPGCGPYPDPRLSYQLGKKGAQIIFHCVDSGVSQIHAAYHESNLRLRALESRLHIVTANAGHAREPVNAPTGVVSPKGEWLVQCPLVGEHKFEFDIEIEAD